MDCKKKEFNLSSDVTYLNCAYMSPLMHCVEEAGIIGIQKKRQPNHISGQDFFTESDILRKEFAQLINCHKSENCVIIPSVSYGMANVAKNLKLKKGDNIIVVGEQFPSNVYPWMEVAQKAEAEIITIAPPNEIQDRGKTWNDQILKTINEKTKLVACGHIHWADGTIFDLRSIRQKTYEVDAWLAVDATQSLGAVPFDIQQLKPDALVAAGYKSLMGPYSIGMAYYGSVLSNGSPIEQSWINRFESENFSNLVNYNENYQPGALRYEVGEHSNFILVPMMLEALKKLNEWKPENIQQYLIDLVDNPISVLRNFGFKIEETKYRASNLFGIRLAEHHQMDKLKSKLLDANIIVSYRGDAIRVSPNIYNDSNDLATLVEVLTTK
ncbi:MAG: aminotransferase class V-fold PLP-dependent enzyme [Balneola sp.]|nr:aminotransferase class V-fold PLP-dependent enzyme [Balneola sp.]MBO6650832.1 aminotransferase class V-fold PLP-dependent enzyme [Balneola sp.]MBO6710059.1 aminotransferase class V-fold PLP-dependent enzyme [Balneola sp.]MBO6798743.1 aminotransferase class V-fold PLP-dependent enzyme [Balneola sp.]MBO6869857.1 aminotransferase class V-fold PLP-dependent enzyme [Balneola sp.]